jgi:predicted transcriptional regulator
VRVRRALGLGRRVTSDQLTHLLEKQFGYRIENDPPRQGSVVRRIDRERKVVTISPSLSGQAHKFQLAATAGLLVLDANHPA